jgi:acetolactate synthase-1/2/3 large subunit
MRTKFTAAGCEGRIVSRGLRNVRRGHPIAESRSMKNIAQETVAERIAAALERHNVEVIFGQSLPSAVILACEAIGIRQLAYRQENMGGAMADGFARVSGRIPVVAAQNGPAATLLVAPLAEALKASVPIVH